MTIYQLRNGDGTEARLSVTDDPFSVVVEVDEVGLDFAQGNPDFNVDEFLEQMRSQGVEVVKIDA